MNGAQARRYPDKAAVAAAAADRLGQVVTQARAERRAAHVVLTGGSMGEELMRAVAARVSAGGLDWSGVHLWWGDERFLPAGDPDRNDTQADEAGLTRLLEGGGLAAERVHRLPGPNDPATGDDLAAAAASYADRLRDAAGGTELPRFDVVMLGVGPDGHVASLFPDHPSTAAARTEEHTVVPVEGSPKPPPRRLSLSLPALCSADEVWFLVAGEDKAEAVLRASGTDDPHECPAGAVRGQRETIWWLDDAAASRLPSR